MGKIVAGPMNIAVAMVRGTYLVDAVYAGSAREYGLTAQQGQLICVLMPQPLGMRELGATLRLAKSSLTGLVDRSARLGLVRREADAEDARAVRVALTDKGEELAGAFYAETCRRVEALTSNLTDAERDTLADLLGRVVEDNEVPVVFMDTD